MSTITSGSSSPLSERPAAPVVTLLRAKKGWQAIDIAELWFYRELMLSLASRDLKLRYKQTALGIIWVVLQPIMAAGIFSFVFGRVAKLSTDGTPYFLFAFVGMLGWNLFSGILIKSSQSLVTNSHLISKVFFPRMILPLSTLPSSLVDFAISLVMVLITMAMYRVQPGFGVILLLPLSLVLLLMLSAGVGLMVSALAVRYRDIQYILPVIVQILLFCSPIAYSVSSVPEDSKWFYRLNPLSAPLEAMRASMLATPLPPMMNLIYSSLIAIVMLFLGAFIFKRTERQFADVI